MIQEIFGKAGYRTNLYIPRKHRYIFLLNCFVGLLIVVVSVVLVRNLLSISLFKAKKDTVTSRPSKEDIKYRFNDYALILKQNPFGFPSGELKSIFADQLPLKSPSVNTQKEIFLIGTVTGPADSTYAIFMDKGGQQEVFRTGNYVFGLGLLTVVEKTKAFIDIGGKETEFSIIDIPGILPESKPLPTPQSVLSKKVGDSSYIIDQRRVEQALENPVQFMSDARFTPKLADGRYQGFLVSELKPDGIFQSLGLKNGDVLLKVNDYEISSPETALRSFTALKGMDRIKLDVIRGGANLTLTYQIK